MTTPRQDDPYLSAMFAELESLANPFQENLEKLEEVIDRSERDGICSEEVAQAVREEIEEWVIELGILFSKTLYLHQGLSNAGSIAALLTREEMLFKLNELGYPLTESYLNKISWGSDGYVGPPPYEPFSRDRVGRHARQNGEPVDNHPTASTLAGERGATA
jgi:hypothetical protein